MFKDLFGKSSSRSSVSSSSKSSHRRRRRTETESDAGLNNNNDTVDDDTVSKSSSHRKSKSRSKSKPSSSSSSSTVHRSRRSDDRDLDADVDVAPSTYSSSSRRRRNGGGGDDGDDGMARSAVSSYATADSFFPVNDDGASQSQLGIDPVYDYTDDGRSQHVKRHRRRHVSSEKDGDRDRSRGSVEKEDREERRRRRREREEREEREGEEKRDYKRYSRKLNGEEIVEVIAEEPEPEQGEALSRAVPSSPEVSPYEASRSNAPQSPSDAEDTSRAPGMPGPPFQQQYGYNGPSNNPGNMYAPPPPEAPNSAGLAADYYNDQGQSVSTQPGFRPGDDVPSFQAIPQPLPVNPVQAPQPQPQPSTIPPPSPEPFSPASHEQPQQPSPQTHTPYSPYPQPSHQPTHSQDSSSHSGLGPMGTAGLAAAGVAAAAHHAQHHDSANHGFQPGSFAFGPKQRQGPLRKFVNFWKDPYGVAQFEEYSEITGVCKDCFEPGTTSKDAPRRHYRRKKSDDRLHKRGKIDKLTRYASSDEESHHKGSKRKSWLAAGLAAYVGKSLFDNQSSSSSGSESSAGKRSRTSRGKIQMSEHDQASVIYKPDASESQSVISGNSRSTDRRTKSDVHHRHHRSSSFSSAASSGRSKRSSGLGLGTAAIAAAAAGSGAVIASKSRRKSRSRSKSPRRPRRTASLSSSSFSDVSRPRGAGMSSFSTFFSAPSENARRGRSVRTKKKKKGGFFGFGGSSYYSSSDDADLAFGSEMLQRSGKRGKSKKSDEDIDAKLLALGAAATSIAAASQSNGKRRADVYAVKERPRKSKYTATEDDDWISASSSSESSGVDSALAFGSSRHSKESLSSDSVASKWRWRWGGRKKRPKPIDTSDQNPGNRDVYPPASDHRNSLQLIAAVDPVPASDSPMIDNSRNAIPSSTVPLVAAGMALSSTGQSQSTVPAPKPFYAPSEPIMQTAGPGPAPGVSRASTEPINYSEPHEFSHRDYVQQQHEQDYDYTPRRIPRKEMTEIRRRDSSPVFSSSQPEEDPDAKLPKRNASVQFDLTQEQADKERRQARLDRERESQRYQPSSRPGLSDKDLASIEYITGPEDLEGDHSSARKMGEAYDQHDTSPSSSSWAAPAVEVPVIKVSEGTGFVPDLDGGYKKRRRSERREERRKHGRFYSDSDVSSIKHTDPVNPSDSDEISERNRRIAKKAARRADRTPPTYDSYVDYFTPEELRHSSAEHSPRSGSVEDLSRVPMAESPSARFEREYAAHSSSRGGEQNLPWPVPRLNLIEPTPPHSVASSIIMSDLESDERRDLRRESHESHRDYEDNQPAEPPIPDSAVPVVPIYETPVQKEFEIEDVTDTTQPDPVSTQNLERDIDTPQEQVKWAPPSGPLESQLISDSPQQQHVPGGFEDDLEFAATLAAGASIAGFDTAIVTEDPTYYRRTSPPGSETEDNKPAAFIIEREAGDEVPPAQGFVEESSLPASDTEAHVQPKDIPLPASTVGYMEPEDASELQRNIDHTAGEPTEPVVEVENPPVKLSKKERRRLKAAQQKSMALDKDEAVTVEKTQPEPETIWDVNYPDKSYEAATEPETMPLSDNRQVEEYERSRDISGPEREILGNYDDTKVEETPESENPEQNGGTPDSFETAHSIESDRETIVPADIGSRALDGGRAFDANKDMLRHAEQESYQHQSIPGAFGDSNSSEAELDTVAASKVTEAQVPMEPEPEPETEKKSKRKSKKKKRRESQDVKPEDDTPREPEESQSSILEDTTEKVIEPTGVAEPTEITELEGLERGASKSKRRSKRYSELIESQTDVKEPEQGVDDASTVISSAKSDTSESKKKRRSGLFGFFGSSKSDVAADKEPAAEERTREIPDDAVSVKSHKSRQSIEQDEAEDGVTEKTAPEVDEDGKKESRKEKKKKKKRKNRYEHIVESGAPTEPSDKDGDRDQGDTKQSEDEYASSRSFLGDSPEMPLASDGASGQDSALMAEELADTVVAPGVEIQSESGLPPSENNRPTSPQPAEDLTKIPSRPNTPPLSSSVDNEDAMKTPRDRNIGASDTTSPSSTKVPLQFRRRGSSVLSFAGRSAPTSPVERRQRPRSTEFKTSREFRPLWLVEQHSTNKPEEPQDEPYPSLPSSKTTSRSSSVEDLRTASYDDFISGISSSRPRRNSLRIGTAGATFDPDVLGSQQATPTAATFNKQLQDQPSESKEKPKYQFHTPSELLEDPMSTAQVPDSQDREIPSSPHGSVIHIGAEKDLDVENLPALPASPAEPLSGEEQLPSLPESRPSTSHSNPITEIAVGEEGEGGENKTPADTISTDRVVSEEVSEDLPALPRSRPSSPVEETIEVALPDQSIQDQAIEELPALPESRPPSPVEGKKEEEEASHESHNEAAVDAKLSPPETPAESEVSFVDALESPGEAAFDGEARELNIPPSLEEKIDDVGQKGETLEPGQDIEVDDKDAEQKATETLDLTEEAPTVPDEQYLQPHEPLTTIDEAKENTEAEQLMEPTSTETPVSRSIEPETATVTEATDQHDAPPSEEKKEEAETVAQPAPTKSKKKKKKRKNLSVDAAADTPSVESPEATEPGPVVENKEAETQENTVEAPSAPVDEVGEKRLDDTPAPQEIVEPVEEPVEKPVEEPIEEPVEEPVEEPATPAAPVSKKKKNKRKNRSVDVAVDTPSVDTPETTKPEPLVENKETESQENAVETPSVIVEVEEKKLDDTPAPQEVTEPVEEPVEEPATPATSGSKKKKKKAKAKAKAEAEAKAKEQEQEQQRAEEEEQEQKREQEQEHQHDKLLDQTEETLQPEASESAGVSLEAPPAGVENTDTAAHESVESEAIEAGDPDQVESDKTLELPVEKEAPPEALEEDKAITDVDTVTVTEESEVPIQSDNIVQDAGQIEADNIPEPGEEAEMQPASSESQQTVTDAEDIPVTEETEDSLEPNTADKVAGHDEPREVSEQQQDEFTEARETVDASDLPAEPLAPVVEDALETAQELPEQEGHETKNFPSEVAIPASDIAEDVPINTEEAKMTELLVSEEVQEKEQELETKDLPSEVALPASDIAEDIAINTEEAQITEPLVSKDVQEKEDTGKHPLEDMQDETQEDQVQPAALSESRPLDEEIKPKEDTFFDSVQDQDISKETTQEQGLASPTKETGEDPGTTAPVEASTEQVDEGGSKAKKKKAKKAKKKKDRRATISEPSEPQPSADSEEVNPDNNAIAPGATSEFPADNVPEASPAAEPNADSQEPEVVLPIDGESNEISDHIASNEKDGAPEPTQSSPLEPEEVVTLPTEQAEEIQENDNAGDAASFKSIPMDTSPLPDTFTSTDVHTSQEQDNGALDKAADVPEPVAEEPETEKAPIEELPEDKQDNEASEEPTITVEAAETVVGDNAPLAEVEVSESQEGPTANEEPPHVTEQTNEEADVLTAPPKLSKKQSKKEKRKQKELQKALNNATLDKNDTVDAAETAVEIAQDQSQPLESQAEEQDKPTEDMPISIEDTQKLSEVETEAIPSIEPEDKTEPENQPPSLDTAEDEKQEPEPETQQPQGQDLEQEQEQITTDNREVPEPETQQQQDQEPEPEQFTADNQEVPEPVDEVKVVEEDGAGTEVSEKKEDTGETPLDTAAPVEPPVVEAPKGKKGKKKKGKKGQKSISLEDEPKISETVIPQAEEAPVEEPPKEELSTEQPSMEQTSVEQASVEQPPAESEEVEKEQPSIEQTSAEQPPVELEEAEKEQPSMEETPADQPSLETPTVESEEAQKEPEKEPEQPASSKSKRKAKKNKKKQKLAEQAVEQEEEQATQQQLPPEVTPPTDSTEAQAETDNPEELPATEEKEETGPIEADNLVSKDDALPSEVEVERLPQNEDQELKGGDESANPKANDDGKEIQHSKSKKKGKKKNKAKTSDWTDEIPTTQVEKEPVTTVADKSTSEESSQTQHEKIEDSTNVSDDKSQQTFPDDLPPTDPTEPNPQDTETSTSLERAAEPDSNDLENTALSAASLEDTAQIPLPTSPIDIPPSPAIDATETTSLTTPEGVDGLDADLIEEPVQANEEQQTEIGLSGDNQKVTTVEPENNTQETTVSPDTHSHSEPTQDPSVEEQGKLVPELAEALQQEPVDSGITVPQEHANSEQTGDSDKTVEQLESDTQAILPEECANNQESVQTAELPPDSPMEPVADTVETAKLSEEGQGQGLAMEPVDSAGSEEVPLDVPVAVETPTEEASLKDAERFVKPETEPPVPSNIDEVDILTAPDTKKDNKKKKKKNRVTFTEPEALGEEKTEQVDAPVSEVTSDEVPNQTEPVETAEEPKPTSKKAKKKKKKGKGAVVDTQEGTSKEEEESIPDAEKSIDVVEETPVDSVENAQRELPLETPNEAADSPSEGQEEQPADQQESAQDIIDDQSLEQEATKKEESELAKETVTPSEAILEDQLAGQPESAQEMPMDQHVEGDGDDGKGELESAEETMPSTTAIEAPVTDIEELSANQPESAQEASTDQPLEGDELARKEEPELAKETTASVEAKVDEAPHETSKSKKKSKKQKKKAKREASVQLSTDELGDLGADVKSSATPEAEEPSEAVEVPSTAEVEEEVQPAEEVVKDKAQDDSAEVLPEKPLPEEQIHESKTKAQESRHIPKEGDDDQWPAIDWDEARIEETDRSFLEGEPEPVSLDLSFPRDQTPEPQSISPYSFPHRIGAFDANASPVQSLIGNMSDPQVLDATIPRQGDQGKGAPETATFTDGFDGEVKAAQSPALLEKQPDETHLEDTVVDEDSVKREIAQEEDVPGEESKVEVEPIKDQALETAKSDFDEYPKDQPQENIPSPVVEKKERKGKKGKKSKQKQQTTVAAGNDEQPGFEAAVTYEGPDAQPLELEAEKIDYQASKTAKDESPGEAERGLTETEPTKEVEDQSLRSSKKKSKKKERKAKKKTLDDEFTDERQHHTALPLSVAHPELDVSAFPHTPAEDSARSLETESTLEPLTDSQRVQPTTTEQPDSEELPRTLPTSQYGSGTELHDDLQMQETTTVDVKGLENDKGLPQFSPEPRKEDDVFTDSPRKKRASTRRKSSHVPVDKPVDRRRSLPTDFSSESLSPHVGLRGALDDHSLDTHTAQTPKGEARDLRDLSPSPSRQPRSIFGGPYGLAEESRAVSPPKTPLGTIKEHSEPKSPPEARGKGEFQRLRIATGSPRQTTPDLSVPKHRDIVRPRSAGASDSEPSPKLRRVSSARSTDLKAASKRDRLSGKSKSPEFDFAELEGIPSSSTYDPVTDKGKIPLRGMAADVYEGWGDVAGPPLSPTRPPSVRRRRSLQHLQDLETRLDQLASENRLINTARENAERTAEAHAVTQRQQARALEARDQAIQNKDLEIQQLKKTTDWLQKEIARLTEVNDGLTATNAGLQSSREIDPGDSAIREQWQRSEQQLAEIREQYTQLSAGMDNIVKNEVQNALADKEAEIQLLRDELTTTQQKVRELQAQIESSAREDIVVFHDEDYFDNACQKLCQHVQQWVLRFSKFSDMRVCRLTRALRDEKLVERFENAILDGSGVDTYLSDRVKRRDVFMSVVMSMMWEYIFTRYLFGMDREQRQKLKTLEKHLTEVGPPSAVQRWRATTLSLLCRRPVFQEHRESDTEAVVQEIYRTLSKLLPPPHELEKAVQDSLRNVMRFAVGLSIEMRTQRAEYVMLPPLKPEYDANGELLHKVYFNATIMNERSGETTSNEALEEQQAVVRMVLFPLVVKKRIEDGQEEAEEEIICPAQVLVARPGKDKKVVRVLSGDRMSLDPSNRSIHSFISPHPSNIM